MKLVLKTVKKVLSVIRRNPEVKVEPEVFFQYRQTKPLALPAKQKKVSCREINVRGSGISGDFSSGCQTLQWAQE